MRASRRLAGATGVFVLALGACNGAGQGDGRGDGGVTPVKQAATSTSPPSASSPSDSAPVPTAGEQWLAFQDSGFRIRLVRPDGTDDHALDAVTTGAEDNPDWSPDGTRLTFVGEGDKGSGAAGLWVVNADGTGLTELVECLAPCQYLDDPAWSPDGSQIMYSRIQRGTSAGGSVEAVDVLTRRTTTLLTAKAGEFFSGVRYAPDGKAVVLEWVHATRADHEDIRGVTLTRVDLTKVPPRVTALTAPKLFAETPDWSSQDLIVYAALPEVGAQGHDLFLIRPDGTGRRRLTTLVEAGSGAMHPDFTNDGSAVVFLGADPDTGKARFMTVDTATGAVSSALASGSVAGHHPRSRPVPAAP